MYYFENDPLQDVYKDLAKDKNPTPFDDTLKLKGSLCEAYGKAHRRMFLDDNNNDPKTRKEYFHKGSKEFIRENMNAFVKWLDMKI